MKETKTLTSKTLQNTMAKGGCGECQTSCQSACKTSCTVGNQSCENNKSFFWTWLMESRGGNSSVFHCMHFYDTRVKSSKSRSCLHD